MLCRFCGKKTNTNGKCDCCSKESPVLLEYKSYENDSIVEKLSLLLESSDESIYNVDIVEVTHDNPNDLADTSSANIHEKDFGNDSLSLTDEILEECPMIFESFTEEQNPQEENYGNKKRTWIRLAAIIGGIILLLSALVYAIICIRNNPKEKSEISDESKMTEMTTIAAMTEDASDSTSTYSETTAVEETTEINTETIETTETTNLVDFGFLDNNSEDDDISFEGNYYSINDSVFSNESSSDFINVFSTKPKDCGSELYLNENSLEYNNKYYDADIEDSVITLKYTDFSGIGEDFIELFNFNEITQSDDYYNDDNKQNELYAFNVSNRKVNVTILCNKLNGLYYGKTNKKYNVLGGLCKFSISNDGKDSVLWIEDINGNMSIKTLYRDSVKDLDDFSGDVVISKSNDGYEIAKLSLDGEKDIYFYHDFDSQDIYMVQYIKYNTENDGISDAILRENEGEEVE